MLIVYSSVHPARHRGRGDVQGALVGVELPAARGRTLMREELLRAAGWERFELYRVKWI